MENEDYILDLAIDRTFIQGSVKSLYRGIENAKGLPKSLIDFPIQDTFGNRLGHITRVEGDTWYGIVYFGKEVSLCPK